MSGAAGALRSGLMARSKKRAKRAKARPIEYSLLLTATMCLLAFGVVMVFSASSSASLLGDTGDGAYYLKRTLMFGVFGLIALRLLSTHGLGAVRKLTPTILVGAVGLLLVTKVIGTSANGAQRWIEFGPVQIQASEIAKVALMLYGAHLLAERPRMTRDLRGLGPFLLVSGAVCALIVVEPDLGTAMVTAFSVAALLIAAGAKIRHLAMIAAALGCLVLIAVLMEPYRMARLTSFINPTADASGAGFQGMQASIALGSGGIFGVGLGESVQKAFYLPEAHTDMIAAVIGEELGMIGMSLLAGLYMLLGYAGFRTAQRARDRYGRLLAAGLTAMILVQASINLFAVLGLAPLTGVTLPFVSYGNSSLIVTLAAVGLLLNVAQGGTARASAAARGGLRVVEGGAARGEVLVPRVVIAAGGTAGHVVPALAVADALAEAGAEVSFVGTREKAEATLVPAAGYEIDFLAVRGVDRKNPVKAAGALLRSGAAVRTARRLLRSEDVDVVVGGGGYVAAPVGAAAVSSGTPLVLTEADSHLGLANRILAPRARRVCLAFPIEGRDGDRYLLTGRPVPASIGSADREAARRRYGIASADRCLLIFGGSLGALTINRAAAGAFERGGPGAGRDFHVLHIAGARDHPDVAQRVAGVERYTLLEYEPDLADALAASDLVLARSGGSIFELAAAGRPAILVPYPYATGRHQHANAEWMRRGGAATVVEDADLDPGRLVSEVEELIGNPEKLAEMAASSASLARPDAAARIAAEVLAAAETGAG